MSEEKEVKSLIDVHSHLLPGLDDGAKDLNSSLQLASQLVQAGYDKVIATPHVLEGRDMLLPKVIRETTVHFNLELKREGVPLEVFPGAENYIFPELPRYLSEKKILTMADSNKYVLLELPVQRLPIYVDYVIFELQKQGIVPVIAHPERYSYLAKMTELLAKWRNKGVLFQVNLLSLAGIYGAGPQKLANWIVVNDLVQLFGTDAHHTHNNPGRYKKTLQSLSKKISPQHFASYFEIYPLAILKGEELKIESGRSESFKSMIKLGIKK